MLHKHLDVFLSTVLFMLVTLSWGQSVSLNASGGTTYCEGQTLTLLPEVSGLAEFTFDLDLDGLANNVFGTEIDLPLVGTPGIVLPPLDRISCP